LTVTVTLLTDHLGSNRPKVMGIEYCVDAVLDITSYTPLGELVDASDLGLSTISAVLITGIENGSTHALAIDTDADGDYASSSTFKVLSTDLDGTNAESTPTANVGCVRVRVWGNL